MDEFIHADVLQHLDGRDVERGAQCLAQQHRAMKAQVVVQRHVGGTLAGGEGRAHVADQRSRSEDGAPGSLGLSGIEGRSVGQRLDSRAGLPKAQRAVHRPVDAGIEIVGAAQHGADGAALRVERHQGRVVHTAVGRPVGIVGQLLQAAADDGLGLLLPGQVQRGVHPQPTAAQRLGPQLSFQFRQHDHHEMRGLDGKGRGGVLQPLRLGPPRILRSQDAVSYHQIEDDGLAELGRLRVFQRVVAGGILGQSGQQGTLGQVQLANVFAEIGLRRGLHAIGEVTVVGLVEVEGQKIVLAEPSLQPPGKPRFPQLAAVAALVALLRLQQ